MKKSGFTMVELIFVIIIIGILASIAVPKLLSVSDGAKQTAEIATISALSTALESANGEWSVNEGNFTWGNKRDSSELNQDGYPTFLSNDKNNPFKYLLKSSGDFINVTGTANGVTGSNGNAHRDINISIFVGPASNSIDGAAFDTNAPNQDIAGVPDQNDFWIYASYTTKKKICKYNGKIFTSGDIFLVDVNGTKPPNYPTPNIIKCE